MTEPDRPGIRLDLVIAAALGLVGLASRLLFLFSSIDRQWPHSVLFEGDAPLWIDWLRAISTNSLFEFGLPIHSPAVTHLLAALGAASIPADWTGYKVLWCVISAMTCSLLYLVALRSLGAVGDRRFARPAALIASLWFALSFHASVLATSLNGEALYTLLLVTIVWIGTWTASDRRVGLLLAITLGILHGLATLVRAEHSLLMLMLVGWNVIRSAPRAVPHPRNRRLALGALTVTCSILVCLPWSVSGTRATHRINEHAERLPEYDSLRPVWTPDARAYMDSLPAFARIDNAAYLSAIASAAREPEINEARVRRYFADEFGYTPEPLRVPVFVSSQGPLCFALANHPDAGGGFSRAAFDTRFGPDPNLTLSLPSHLRLYNEGYSVGLGFIREDPSAWLTLVGQKLLRFEGGITGGLGTTNMPLGRTLVRQPVDIATSPIGSKRWWSIPILSLVAVGALRLIVERKGTPWLIVIAAKLIVTIAFYGYARQSASILPAFAVLIAYAISWPIDRLSHARKAIYVAAPLIACGVLIMDLAEYSNPRLPTIEADHDKVRPARVNASEGAFECVAPMSIEYLDPSAEGP